MGSRYRLGQVLLNSLLGRFSPNKVTCTRPDNETHSTNLAGKNNKI